jgi:selenocysteine-specific elongation factor
MPGALEPTNVVDVEWAALRGVPLPKHRSEVRLHAFASETTATVLLYADPRLARLKLREPLLLLPGDRVVLRRPAHAATVAGARVVDAHPLRRVRKAAALAWLSAVLDASPGRQLLARVARRGKDGVTAVELTRETGWKPAALAALLAPLLAGKKVVRAGEHLLTSDALAAATGKLMAELQQLPGEAASRAELLSRSRLTHDVFAQALAQLQTDVRVEITGQQFAIRKKERIEEHPKLAQLEALYREAGLASPLVSEAAQRLALPLAAAVSLATQLLRQGKLVRMGADNLLIHADALRGLRAQLATRRGESFDVPTFKSWTGLTRKHAIPVLEYLDGVRATRNKGGVRTVE